MIAFDTNLLVRIAVNDDEEQAEIAEQLLSTNDVFISRTVLLKQSGFYAQFIKNHVLK